MLRRFAMSPSRIVVGGIGRAILVLLVFAPAYGCKNRGPKVFDVAAVRVSEANVAAHPSLGLGADGLRALAEEELAATGRFRLAPNASSDATIISVRLDDATVVVRSTEESIRRAMVSIGIEQGGERRREATGAGEIPFTPGNPDARGAAFQAALRLALSDAVRALCALADAEAAPDATLVASLGDPDRVRREFALRVLVERKAQAAIEPLLGRLSDPNADEVLRAASALAAIGDERVAPALIDAASRRDGAFVARIATALGDLGGSEAEAYLFTAAGGHPDAGVRTAAADALATLRDNRRRQAAASQGLP